MKRIIATSICFGLTLSGASLSAETLMDVFHLAEQQNPQYEAVKHRFEAQKEVLTIGRAALLPQVSADAAWDWKKDDVDFTDGGPQTTGIAGRHGYDSKSISLTLRQPIFNWYAIRRYQRAKREVAQSALQFEGAHQQLILGSAKVYLNVLLAEESLETAKTQKKSLEKYYLTVKKSYDAGLADVTTMDEAKARLDGADTDLITAENDLVIAKYDMDRFVGKKISDLDPVDRDMDLTLPVPADRQHWVDAAVHGNLNLQAAELGVQIARYKVGEASGNRYPTVDLVANQYWSEEDQIQRPVDIDDSFFGVRMSIPLFTGGLLSAQVKSSEALLKASRSDREEARRNAIYDTASAYTNVFRYESACQAARQAVTSSKSALESTKIAVSNGLRTPLDELDALRQYYSALQTESTARYAYLLSRLQLRYAIGDLRESDLATLMN